ncbi:Cyclophilin type peptidyl-prolyl cis-trans isomerase/CLD [Musa troglodytarum]|uniref:Cyclophilin type peptidyl-prolyl cis-trans isomerase/CLD n=1 Tax=Musa troglodytarum TaxID=320322 RepID=A0A9E7K3F7_9LILI|nr:Cyclophilin type peptidyl-prolyl cis-trans isomerase/CLD [Musa troglodytarum]URE01927.1 Cyclophilin type peptidyl-prolyl cis-trans isomerase/CLD [Musa troglodytarum]
MAMKKNPIVFLDISVDRNPAERMEIELFADVVPKTAENFRALCTDRSDGLAFVRSFLSSSLLLCAAPSIVEGEDGSFLRPKRTPLKLHPPMMSPFAASATVLLSLPLLPPLLSAASVATAAVVHSFLPYRRLENDDYQTLCNREVISQGEMAVVVRAFMEENFQVYAGNENFKLKHDGPGLLSMASSAPNSNGSQFFITFKATPQLDGKNVVFGKVVSGSNMLKKIEQAGSEKGKPLCLVKIVDCGEAYDNKTQVAPGKEKEKKHNESGLDLCSNDSSGGEQRSSHKRTIKDKRKKRKRRYSSSDSSSSDDSDSDSYSSDSGSSYSDSSDSSSSSGARYKRRKRTSRKKKNRNGKGKRDHHTDKRQRRHDKKSTRKPKWSSSSSDSESETTSSSSSSGSERSGHRDDTRKAKRLLQTADTSVEVAGKKQSLSAVPGKESAPERTKKSERAAAQVNASRESSLVFQENRDDPEDSYRSIGKLNKMANQPPKSNEKSSRSSSPIIPEGDRIGSPRLHADKGPTSSPSGVPHIGGANQSSDRRISRSKSRSASPTRSPGGKASEPALKQQQDVSRKPSPSGPPKRIRKGRGFSDKYAYVRKYRTPSPERSPIRSHYYRGRYEQEWGRNRYSRRTFYSERSPARRYQGSPRGSSPPRYRGRRDRSRSLSHSPVGYRSRRRDRTQSPRRSRSPLDDQKPALGNRIQSRLGPQGGGYRSVRGRSRSRSPRPSDAGPRDMEDKGGGSRSSSRSSSPAPNNGLVAYGDGSPDR